MSQVMGSLTSRETAILEVNLPVKELWRKATTVQNVILVLARIVVLSVVYSLVYYLRPHEV